MIDKKKVNEPQIYFSKKDICYIENDDAIRFAIVCKNPDNSVNSIIFLSNCDIAKVKLNFILQNNLLKCVNYGLPNLKKYFISTINIKDIFLQKRLVSFSKKSTFTMDDLETMEKLYNQSKKLYDSIHPVSIR